MSLHELPAFSNRLLKNSRHLGRWARREGIACYRVYDRDIPQFPFAIDVYGNWAHMQEFDTGWQMADTERRVWLNGARAAVADALQLPPQQVVHKQRQRQRGTAQYEKTDLEGEAFVVEEWGAKFWVNLQAYLDTGLFLDHRQTRRMVKQRAAGRRLLNLFAYTGSFSVQAGLGGASATVSVDLSRTYLDWAARNIALNGLPEAAHQRVQADVFSYLTTSRDAGERFDIIVLDPPSFSNSKRMQGVLDVQRDHALLIDRCMALLTADGELYFSTNLRSFDPDPGWLPQDREITRQTVPMDFRARPPHRCWRLGATA